MRIIASLLFLALAGPAAAQSIVSPSGATREPYGCEVRGLDPNGDGFLAVRSGPGTNYRKIAELYNGDAAFMDRACQGRWCYFEGAVQNGRRTNLRGWIYDAWCSFYP